LVVNGHKFSTDDIRKVVEADSTQGQAIESAANQLESAPAPSTVRFYLRTELVNVTTLEALGAIAQGRFVVLLMTLTELLTRHATDANVTRLHDDKGTKESLALLPHEPPDSLNQGLASVAREADQDDTGRFGMTDEDQPAKVFILCQQDTFLATGLINQFAVVGAARCFAHGEDIIALCPQSAHDGKVTAFVGQKAQGKGIHQAVCNRMVSWASEWAA